MKQHMQAAPDLILAQSALSSEVRPGSASPLFVQRFSELLRRVLSGPIALPFAFGRAVWALGFFSLFCVLPCLGTRVLSLAALHSYRGRMKLAPCLGRTFPTPPVISLRLATSHWTRPLCSPCRSCRQWLPTAPLTSMVCGVCETCHSFLVVLVTLFTADQCRAS